MNNTPPSNPPAPAAPVARGTLAPGALHPAVVSALDYVVGLPPERQIVLQDVFSTAAACAEGSFAAVCAETLRRIIHREPVGDRYVLALAWVIFTMNPDKSEAG